MMTSNMMRSFPVRLSPPFPDVRLVPRANLFSVPCVVFSGGGCLIVGLGRLAGIGRLTLGQHAVDLGQEQRPHLVARRLVEPVEKPAAGRRLAEALIDL